MRKLTLEIETLAVESFSTADSEEGKGTVQGHDLIPTPPHLTCAPLTRLTDCPCTP